MPRKPKSTGGVGSSRSLIDLRSDISLDSTQISLVSPVPSPPSEREISIDAEDQTLPVQDQSDRPLAGQIREPKECRFRLANTIRSRLIPQVLDDLFRNLQSKCVLFYDAEGEDRIHNPPIDATGFYSKFLRVGVGVPVHPFFISMPESHRIAPAQLNPIAWCHMLGVFLMWDDLGFGVPSLNVWHHLYKIHPISDHPYFYYFTKWASDKGILIERSRAPPGVGAIVSSSWM